MFAAYLGEVMIFLPSFCVSSRPCLPFCADNEQLLGRKQGSRGFPLQQITQPALWDTGTTMACPAPRYLGVFAYASLKDYSTLPKMATSSRSFMTSALGEITEPKIHAPCSPSRLGEGKQREGMLPLFLFPNSEIKGLVCDFLPNVLGVRFPLMGNENVNYLG